MFLIIFSSKTIATALKGSWNITKLKIQTKNKLYYIIYNIKLYYKEKGNLAILIIGYKNILNHFKFQSYIKYSGNYYCSDVFIQWIEIIKLNHYTQKW